MIISILNSQNLVKNGRRSPRDRSPPSIDKKYKLLFSLLVTSLIIVNF